MHPYASHLCCKLCHHMLHLNIYKVTVKNFSDQWISLYYNAHAIISIYRAARVWSSIVWQFKQNVFYDTGEFVSNIGWWVELSWAPDDFGFLDYRPDDIYSKQRHVGDDLGDITLVWMTCCHKQFLPWM